MGLFYCIWETKSYLIFTRIVANKIYGLVGQTCTCTLITLLHAGKALQEAASMDITIQAITLPIINPQTP